MAQTIGPEAGGPDAPPTETTGPASSTTGRSDRRALRRQFLVGGAVAAGAMVTLANRPALAQGSTKACSVSAVTSLVANPNTSIATSLACGDPPSCWCGRDVACWQDGAKFGKINVKYTHSTNICINTLFPVLNGNPFVNGGSSNNTLYNLINGSGNISVKCKNGKSVALWTKTQQGNIVAAILNDYFYGDRYYPGSILTVIATCLNSVVSYAGQNNTNNIASACASLDSSLGSYNNRGDSCAL